MREGTEYLADFFKILADPILLAIINFLKSEEKTANQLRSKLNISQAYTSQQLKKLIKRRIIGFRKEKVNKYYIRNPKIFEILSSASKFMLDIDNKRRESLEKFLNSSESTINKD